ncbi:MAG: SURF1 family protein [Pseudomonadales bacterium]|nr:SURF1 family protein [Pseudomonadales bacterium]
MTIKLNWKLTAFSVFFLLVFLRLGFWQLNRAVEKEELEQREATIAQEVWLQDRLFSSTQPDMGTRVRLQGEYLAAPEFYLDNVVLQGKPGFEVLNVFREAVTGQHLLIDRGFVPMMGDRSVKPVPPPLSSPALVNGKVYVFEKRASFRPEELIDPLGIVQTADPQVLEGLLPQPLYPFLVRLEENDENALPRKWQTSNMSPQKHRGYALQWFTMALAVIAAFGYFTYKTNQPNETQADQE